MGKLLRKRDVLEVLGMTDRQLRTVVECGLLRPLRQPGRKFWFRAADVRRLAGE